MYESFLPDFYGASAFYNSHQTCNLIDLFISNAESYFTEHSITFTVERKNDCAKFNTPKGLFILSLRNNTPTAVSVYSIANTFVKQFRDAIWVTKKVFGFPVGAVMDNADDGYFETHPSRFNVIIYPKMK